MGTCTHSQDCYWDICNLNACTCLIWASNLMKRSQSQPIGQKQRASTCQHHTPCTMLHVLSRPWNLTATVRIANQWTYMIIYGNYCKQAPSLLCQIASNTRLVEWKKKYIRESQRMKGSRSDVEPRRGPIMSDKWYGIECSHTHWPTLNHIGPIVRVDWQD